MRPVDKAKQKARRIVAERFRVFVATLMTRFVTTPAELWKRAETSALAGQRSRDKAIRRS